MEMPENEVVNLVFCKILVKYAGNKTMITIASVIGSYFNVTANILKKLCIDNKHPIEYKKGAVIITDNEFNRTILISPPSKLKTYYVMVRPESVDGIVERYAMDGKGNILATYKSPDAMRTFNKTFDKLLIK